MSIATHIPEAELVHYARCGESHPHLKECAFCREQLEQLRELLVDVERVLDGQVGSSPRHFRLAAQSASNAVADIIWRQTWYLDEGRIVIRVVEDSREGVLVGYFLGDRHPGDVVHIRFSDLDRSFSPDAEGRFIIGPSSIEIEPMSAFIE
jgi:hypothetical protein